MSEWPPLISAGAASLAAVLAGANLYFSGRREHLSWTRSALEHALVDFLTAHYQHLDVCREVALEGRAEASDEGTAIEVARAADATMMSCITRFRVLASSDLARSALALRRFNDSDLSLLEAGKVKELGPSQERSKTARKEARNAFVQMAQDILAVGR